MGKSLDSVIAECKNCVAQIQEVNIQDQVAILDMYWKLFLDLKGQEEEFDALSGFSFTSSGLFSLSNDGIVVKTVLQEASLDLGRLEYLVLYGEYEQAADFAIKIGEQFAEKCPSHFFGMMETFHRGVALYAMARRTKKRKYKTHAKRIRKTIKTWMRKGNPNVEHYLLFLNAEQAAINKDFKSANESYKRSIALAARTGNLHHAGLLNERYAEFLLRDMKDEKEACYRLQEAIRFYKEWGAEKKAQILEEALLKKGHPKTGTLLEL